MFKISSCRIGVAVVVGLLAMIGTVHAQTEPDVPHVITHPMSQVLQPGDTIHLSMEATGKPPLQYQWSFNGKILDGAQSEELVILNATPEHTGNYAVTVFNDLGIAESAIARVTIVNGAAIEFPDFFDQRTTIAGTSGMALGNNFGATREEEEPEHGGHPARRSVWVTWTAPADGIATFTTEGSDFDTILGIYADKKFIDSDDEIPSGNGTAVTSLKTLEEVTDDDDGKFYNSSYVQFPVIAGVPYEIAVDGFQGATGNIILGWDFFSLLDPLPVILQLPPDRSVKEGDALELTVNFQFNDDVEIRWLRDGREIDGAESATLNIPSFSLADLGRYQLRLKTEAFDLLTQTVEIQINTEGRTETIARDKLEAAIQSALIEQAQVANATGNALSAASTTPIGLTRGFSGSQIFETLFATKDPGEPDHCGIPGGASYWFVLQTPTTGNLSVDTMGSDYDTVLAVYTSSIPPAQYSDLLPVDCNNDLDASTSASKVTFEATAGATYYVVVDGVNGAKGRVSLNYSLETVVDRLMNSLAFRVLPANSIGKSHRIKFTASPGFEYSIEYMNGLGQNVWNPLNTSNIVVETTTEIELPDPAENETQRFYRILIVPALNNFSF